MSRLFPKSLLGQVMLVLALGLLVGQAISAVMLYRAEEQRREEAIVHSLAFRLVSAAEGHERAERIASREARRLEHKGHPERLPMMKRKPRIRHEVLETSPIVDGDERLPNYENTIRELLDFHELEASDLVVLRRLAGNDAFVAERSQARLKLGGAKWQKRPILLAAIQKDGGSWHVVRLPEPRPPRSALGPILLQTIVTFAVLFLLLLPLMRRITRPLAQLTSRVGSFAQNPGEPVTLEESGPRDVRHLIAAHNAMEARISAMLDEKDVMLGAIGHDLKTPLAALRVRIESVPDEVQRTRMAESIEDITHTLDDILNLARAGRATEPPEQTDFAALITSLVGEYEDMGEPVETGNIEPLVAPARATWLRRAVRNLIGNAIRYGERAHVSLEKAGGQAVIVIEDEGPGIPEGQIAEMLEPFRRGETSRNRSTGGAGLGLTLARAIAEQHGGELRLANRAEGGLRAEIRLPLEPDAGSG